MKKLLLIILVIGVCMSCGDDPITEGPSDPIEKPTETPDDNEDESPIPPSETATYSVKGNVQKGPFTQGTSITIQALDDELNPIGKNYQTKTIDDAGSFKIDNQIESKYVEIIATGYYFNEISGRVSSSPITLRALSDLTETGKTNVNILTTLESDRIRKLVVDNKKSIREAREQTEQELFDIFHIPNAVSQSSGFDKLDITQEGASNAILLAISTSLQADRSEGELSELISKIASEMVSSGNISNEIIAEQIRAGGMSVNAESVRTNLNERYNALGISDYAIPPFEEYLDVNGNGVIDKKESWLILNQKDFSISDEGGEITVELRHNVDYDIIIEDNGEEWISDNSTKSYLETHELIFNIAPNTTYDDRFARIAVKDRSSSYTEYITISQKQHDALIITSNKYEIDKIGGVINVEVKANINFTVEIPAESQSWISQLPTKGLTASELQFTINKYDGADTRVGEIHIKNGNLSDTIKIYQTGEKVLVLNPKEYTVSDKGTTIEIDVTSNLDYEIIMPSVDWITQIEQTRGIITNTRSFSISENTTYDPREAEIIFRDINSNFQEKVTIYQTQHDAIIIAQKSYDFDNEGGFLSLELKTNVNVEVEIPTDYSNWISQIQTRGLTNQSLDFTIASNHSYDKRAGEIIIKQIGGDITDTIRIYQAQKNAIILTQNSFELSEQGENFTIEVRSNVDFTVNISGGSWLRQIVTRGLVSHTLMFVADANTTYDSRDAVITITNNENNLSETIKVHQSQKDAIIIGTDRFDVPYTGGVIDVNIKSNVDYEVAITSGNKWIEQISTRALTASTVSFNIIENPDIVAREGTIEIRDLNNGITNTIVVMQAGSTATRTIHIANAGSLSSLLSDIEQENLVNIKLTGNIDLSDFKTLEEMPKLTELDLSEVQVSGNKIPDEAMCTLGNVVHIATCTSKSNIQKLILPQTTTSIGEYAFAAMKKLSRVILPSSLTSIGNGAFYYTMIDSITLPDNLTIIGEEAFSSCEYLKSIDIPDNVTTIRKRAFAYCSSLVSVNFTANSKLQRIESEMSADGIGNTSTDGVFRNCTSLRRFELPASVTVIGAGTFNGCTALEELIIPSNTALTQLTGYMNRDEYVIGAKIQTSGIVEGCSSLKILYIPAKIKTLDKYVFAECGIETVIFEEGSQCSKIGDAVFAKCYNLKNIEIPQSVKILGNCVFINCEALESFDFSQFSSVGDNPISGCISLKHVVLPPYLNELTNDFFSNCVALESCILPQFITSIGNNAFRNCANLKSIDIPQSVTEIGSYAFENCSSLESVVIPSNVINIYYSAFQGCSALQEVSLSDNKEITIGSNAFADCSSLQTFRLNAKKITLEDNIISNTPLTQIIIPSEVEYFCGYTSTYYVESTTWNGSNINEFHFESPSNLKQVMGGAFAGSQITSLTLPESVTELGDGTFGRCPALTDWEIPAHIKKLNGNPFYLSNIITPRINEATRLEYVGDMAFSEMRGLSFVDISSATFVGKNVFQNCADLKQVILPDHMTSISEYMFDGCSQLESIDLPPNVTSIEYRAFQGCSSLQNIDLSNVETISGEAFRDCMSLSNIDLSNVSTIWGCAFLNCSSLTSITVGSSGELTLDYCIFYGCNNLETITIPSGITKLTGGYYSSAYSDINGGTFTGTSAKIIIEDNSQIKEIGKAAFSGAIGIESISLPNLTTITTSFDNDGAFKDCINLKRCNFPQLTDCYGREIFNNCLSLEEINWPKLQNLEAMALYGSIPITKIVFPETLQKIYTDIYTESLNFGGEIICKATVPPSIDNNKTSMNWIPSNGTLRVPANSIDAYKNDAVWGLFSNILPIE